MSSRPERLLAALDSWRNGRGPLFARLAAGLVQAGEQGALPATGELPAERVLASALGISRGTVAAAYEELRSLGLAVTRHGSGTVLRNALPPAAGSSWPSVAGVLARGDASKPVIDLTVGAPPIDDVIASLTLSGAALVGRVASHGYTPLGWSALRALIAERLSDHGAPTSPEEVLVTNGAQEAISLAIGLVAGGGRRIAVESPGYPGALDAIARAGGRPLAVGRDAGGLRLDELKQLLEGQHLHALYVAPSCNNPTGGRTAEHRRERLAALAAEHGFIIIEDTVLDRLAYAGDPGIPLWAHAPERVLAAGSLSKVAWAGLRVGWLRAPRPIVLRLGRIKGNIGVGAFDQLAALEVLENYDRVITRRRAQAVENMETLVAALRRELPDWSVEPVDGGWSLWVTLPIGSAAAYAQTALRHGVAVAGGSANSPDEAFPECVRICFGVGPALLDQAASRLASAWSEFTSSELPVTTLAGS